jgi:hypothetical protein
MKFQLDDVDASPDPCAGLEQSYVNYLGVMD